MKYLNTSSEKYAVRRLAVVLFVAAMVFPLWDSMGGDDASGPGAVKCVPDAAPADIAWVRIPGGEYDMGCSSGDKACEMDETPVQHITVAAFSLMKYEVTQGQYRAVTGKHPSHFGLCGDDCPVEKVSWRDARAFCENIGGRLPTEAEWEYAARAGTTTPRYGKPDDIAWYGKNSRRTTHPVGTKQPNAWGLYDMLGNVWEWVEDCYAVKPGGPADCGIRVLRGSSWFIGAAYLRASNRGQYDPSYTYNYIGFRCARDAAAAETAPENTAKDPAAPAHDNTAE